MNKEEFAKLKVGDKVLIVSDLPDYYVEFGSLFRKEMKKWFGRVMTIREIIFGVIFMVEDQEEHYGPFGPGWAWNYKLIEKKIEAPAIFKIEEAIFKASVNMNELSKALKNTSNVFSSQLPTITEHLIKGNKTIVKLSNGKVGVAQCSPEDKFDIYEGLRLATARAYGKEPPFKKPVDKPKVREVERFAKVGEWIKIVHGALQDVKDRYYKNGDILKVYKIDTLNKGSVYCELKKKVPKYLGRSNDNGNIRISPWEYIVLENYKPEKKS